MRIACVHIPQFALQCATRIDPSLRRGEHGAPTRGEPAIIVAGHGGDRSVLHTPIVLACSRAAWVLGARVGMTATTARGLSPEIEVVTADPQLERDTVRAIADAVLALSPVVDLGGRVGPAGAHLALYCEVPAKTRGTSFGDRVLERLEALGLTGRIGIADDRFTAWVAASHEDDNVVSVPRGGSAAFLAPRPLSLLSITPEVQHMLEALGVRTMGEFAALPAPTVSSRGPRFEADYQALARGESGNFLRPYSPDAPIREEALVHANKPNGLSAPAAIALLAERIAMRLVGRARCAARLEISIFGSPHAHVGSPAVGGDAGERVVPMEPVRNGSVLSAPEELAEAIGNALGDDIAHAWRLRVVVTGEALAGETAADVAAAAAAALEMPTQRTFSTVTPSAGASSASRSASASASPSRAAANTNDLAATTHDATDIDPIAIVLSSTGSGMFGLTSPVARDAHRRTRRGKQRRRTPTNGTIQPRLFKL